MQASPDRSTCTVTAPAYWASALVNGDFSGLDANEAALCQAFIEDLAEYGFEVVDVARYLNGEPQEPRFTWSYYLYGDKRFTGGDVLDYVAVERE